MIKQEKEEKQETISITSSFFTTPSATPSFFNLGIYIFYIYIMISEIVPENFLEQISQNLSKFPKFRKFFQKFLKSDKISCKFPKFLSSKNLKILRIKFLTNLKG